MIYLASASPRRKEILRKMKVPFRVVPSLYREKNIPDVGPDQIVMWHACQKARLARIPRQARFVLGADTLVVLGGRIFGKPRSKKEALKMLSLLSGRAHLVYTGLSIVDHKTRHILTGFAKTRVRFKKLSSQDIRNYLDHVNPLDKAGAYAVQEGPRIVAKVEGSYSNVVGLPVELLRKMLRDLKED